MLLSLISLSDENVDSVMAAVGTWCRTHQVEQVEARITANTIEIFHKGERIAAHRRSSGNGKHTTTIRANAEPWSGSRNNPTVISSERHTHDYCPWAGRPFRFRLHARP